MIDSRIYITSRGGSEPREGHYGNWRKAEGFLLDSTADVLVIFDCCYPYTSETGSSEYGRTDALDNWGGDVLNNSRPGVPDDSRLSKFYHSRLGYPDFLPAYQLLARNPKTSKTLESGSNSFLSRLDSALQESMVEHSNVGFTTPQLLYGINRRLPQTQQSLPALLHNRRGSRNITLARVNSEAVERNKRYRARERELKWWERRVLRGQSKLTIPGIVPTSHPMQPWRLTSARRRTAPYAPDSRIEKEELVMANEETSSTGSNRTPLLPLVFDVGNNSAGTYPSTKNTSNATSSLQHNQLETGPPLPQLLEGDCAIADGSENHPENEQQAEKVDEIQTIYSVETVSEDQRLEYLQEFASRLTEDVETLGRPSLIRLPPSVLTTLLEGFAQRLHAEASNPLQWETSVILHRNEK